MKPRDSQEAHNSGMTPSSANVLSDEVGASGSGDGERPFVGDGERDELEPAEEDASADMVRSDNYC